MSKKIPSNSCFFAVNKIDLSFQANAESQAFTSKLRWENLALKIITKLKILANATFKHAIRRRIEHKIYQQKPLSPYDLIMYRGEYYEEIGSLNYRRIIQKIDLESTVKNYRHKDFGKQQFPKLFLQQLVRLASRGKLKLVSHKQIPERRSINSDSEVYIFFDSHFFFNGGHIANIEQKVDNLISNNNNITFIFLLDRRMILFPALSKLILYKYDKIIIFDATDFPIKLSEDLDKCYAISKLSEIQHLNTSNSIISRNSIFNPTLSWKNYPYGSNGNPQKAWCRAFSRSDSRNIVTNEFSRLPKTKLKRDYVVIHARNSTLMSDNIRNTKPLIDREKLLRGIINMGIQIIVLGIMEPSSKFNHNDIYYADELGPITDDLQIHILHGAIGVIGSPSGVTHLTYCTDTPLLLIDMPFPFCTCYPGSNMKSLLKRLKQANHTQVSISKYYDYSQLAHQEEVRNLKAFSPLHQDNIELECNSDDAILHAFQELLIDSYDRQSLQHLNTNEIHKSIDFEAMKRDKQEITSILKSCKDESDRFPYFKIRDLSEANWFQD